MFGRPITMTSTETDKMANKRKLFSLFALVTGYVLFCCLLVKQSGAVDGISIFENDSNSTNCNFTDIPCQDLPVECIECDSDNFTTFNCTYGQRANATCTVTPDSDCKVSLCVCTWLVLYCQ